jgi:hypothetical protein
VLGFPDIAMWPILVIVAGVATPLVILACRYRAKRAPFDPRPITDQDRSRVRAQGRVAVVAFIAFWVISVGLILGTELRGASDRTRWVVYWVVVALAVSAVGHHLSIRCPSCGYRLGYQRSLWVPPHCERCGAALQRP